MESAPLFLLTRRKQTPRCYATIIFIYRKSLILLTLTIKSCTQGTDSPKMLPIDCINKACIRTYKVYFALTSE